MRFIKQVARAILRILRGFADFSLRRNLNDVKVEADCSYEFAGTPGYSQYAFCSENLGGGSIVYSLGIGEDASFDKQIIERYGVKLHAFDFTPRAIKYMEANQLPGLTFHPYGVAAKDGSLTFYAPYQAKNVSWSNVPRNTESQTFPVKRLPTIMRELGHTHLDILKMDIEGAEYEVLEDMLASGIRPTQLLVEFQHRFEGVGIGKTKRMLKKLHKAGYRIFYMTEDKTEFSLLFVEQPTEGFVNLSLQLKALYYPLLHSLGPVVVTDNFGIKTVWQLFDETPIKKLITRQNYKHEFAQYDRYARGEVAIDVGANVGVHSIYLSRLARKVYAFEPVASTFQRLEETIALNGAEGKIEAHRLGVGERPGMMEMQVFSPGYSSWNSVYVPQNQDVKPVGTELVPVTTLDKFVKDKDLRQIDFVKIDVEGYELEVLKGAAGLLREKRIKTLSFEVTQMHAYNPEEIFSLLRSYGYQVEDYKPDRPHHNYYARS